MRKPDEGARTSENALVLGFAAGRPYTLVRTRVYKLTPTVRSPGTYQMATVRLELERSSPG